MKMDRTGAVKMGKTQRLLAHSLQARAGMATCALQGKQTASRTPGEGIQSAERWAHDTSQHLAYLLSVYLLLPECDLVRAETLEFLFTRIS